MIDKPRTEPVPSQGVHTPSDDLMADLQAYQRVAVMHALASHDVLGAIEQGNDTPEAIARVCQLHAPSLPRLLRAALDMGLVGCDDDGGYRVTERGHRLDPDHPNSLHSAIMLSVEQYWPAWRALHQAVRTGLPTFEDVHGCPPWEWRRRHPAQGRFFNEWQVQQSRLVMADVVAALDLASAQTVVDIAGGQGTLLRACFARWPHLQLVLFEQEHTLAAMPPRMGEDPPMGQVAGDFFRGIPVSGDVFLLKSILHDWEDEAAVTILRHCAQAMQAQTRLIVVERVLNRGLSPQAHMVDLAMLLVTGGRERSLEEYVALFSAAGLQMVRLVPTSGDFSLIECQRSSEP